MNIRLIENNSDLESCINSFNKTSRLALDLEFDKNYHRYGFNLCLLQIYADGTCFLIDPLSDDLDIERLFPTLEDKNIEKIVFAFGEDLRLLHSLGCYPKNIYDLNIATNLLNYKPASLTNYIADILQVDTGKSSQQSNWYQRPLSEQQKMYAAEDVLYLFDLKSVLEKDAEQAGISGWIAEENETFDRLDYTGEADNNVIKQKDKKDLTEVEWHIFKKLLAFREEISEIHDKPGFKVIKKDYLTRIAKNPRHLTKWENTRGIYRAIKTDEMKEKLARLLREGAEEAEELNLSRTEPADKPLTEEEYALRKKERQEINRLKARFFVPVKKKISEDYGKEAATFMLSNRIVSELITGEYGELENYKRELFVTYARELDLNIDKFMEILEPEED